MVLNRGRRFVVPLDLRQGPSLGSTSDQEILVDGFENDLHAGVLYLSRVQSNLIWG